MKFGPFNKNIKISWRAKCTVANENCRNYNERYDEELSKGRLEMNYFQWYIGNRDCDNRRHTRNPLTNATAVHLRSNAPLLIRLPSSLDNLWAFLCAICSFKFYLSLFFNKFSKIQNNSAKTYSKPFLSSWLQKLIWSYFLQHIRFFSHIIFKYFFHKTD